jgi:hypothetical protein
VDLTEHADYIEQQALNIAIRAKAVKQCFFHPDVIIDLGDPDAEKRAYAMGTNYWKKHKDDMMVECVEFMEAIKDALGSGCDECYQCTKYRDA